MGAISIEMYDGTLVLDAPTVEKGIENVIDAFAAEVDEELLAPEEMNAINRWSTSKIKIIYHPDKTLKELANPKS